MPEEKKNLPTKNKKQNMTPYNRWYEMDKTLEDMRSQFFNNLYPVAHRYGDSTLNRTPALDLVDLGDKYEVTVELPGIPKEEVDVEVTPNGVEISANQIKEDSSQGKNWIYRERSKVDFHRIMSFPDEVKPDGVQAEMKKGILTLVLPKTNPRPYYKGKRIEIK